MPTSLESHVVVTTRRLRIGTCVLLTGVLLVSGFVGACNTGLEPARDLSGVWLGTGPNGARYEDNVANPNCRYEADLRLVLDQNGSSLAGSLRLTVRKAEKLLATNLPCIPVGTENQQALFGQVGSSRVNFTLIDGITVFSAEYTSNIMSGDFVVNAPNSVIGTFTVTR